MWCFEEILWTCCPCWNLRNRHLMNKDLLYMCTVWGYPKNMKLFHKINQHNFQSLQSVNTLWIQFMYLCFCYGCEKVENGNKSCLHGSQTDPSDQLVDTNLLFIDDHSYRPASASNNYCLPHILNPMLQTSLQRVSSKFEKSRKVSLTSTTICPDCYI